jgi:hypothetical protein
VVLTALLTCWATVMVSPGLSPLVLYVWLACVVPFQVSCAVMVAGRAAALSACTCAWMTGWTCTRPLS